MAEKKTSTRRTKKSSDSSTKEVVLEKDSAPTVDLERAAAEKAAAEKAAAKSLVGKKVKTSRSAIFFVKEQLDENTVLVGKLKKSKTYKYDISSLKILD